MVESVGPPAAGPSAPCIDEDIIVRVAAVAGRNTTLSSHGGRTLRRLRDPRSN